MEMLARRSSLGPLMPCLLLPLPTVLGYPLGGATGLPTGWGDAGGHTPHIYRKKKEKKNKRRNGTGSA